jgi:hypothetical protein
MLAYQAHIAYQNGAKYFNWATRNAAQDGRLPGQRQSPELTKAAQ